MSKPTTKDERMAERVRKVEEANATPAERAAARRLRGEERPTPPEEMSVEEMRKHLAD